MSTMISNVLLAGSIVYLGFAVFPSKEKDSAETFVPSAASVRAVGDTSLFSGGRGKPENGRLPDPALRSHKNPPLKKAENRPAQGGRDGQTWAVDQLSRILSDFRRPQKDIAVFVERVRQTSLEPAMSRQGDGIDGQFFVLRTANALAGTRNFHAQFFNSGKGSMVFMQHMSFEIEAGEGAFARAQELVRRYFPDLGEPVHQSANYVGWKTSDGYSVWIKVWRKEDLPMLFDDPYTAYSADDIGSVHVAIEEEIH